MPPLDIAKAGAIPAGARGLGLELPQAAFALAMGIEVAAVLVPVVARFVDTRHVGVAAALIGVGVVAAVVRVPQRLARVKLEGVALPLLPGQDGQAVGGGRRRVELRQGLSVSDGTG